jgi:hypothetical protein
MGKRSSSTHITGTGDCAVSPAAAPALAAVGNKAAIAIISALNRRTLFQGFYILFISSATVATISSQSIIRSLLRLKEKSLAPVFAATATLAYESIESGPTPAISR